MIRDFPTPPTLGAAASAWLADERPAPAVPRPAATVLLVRNREAGDAGAAGAAGDDGDDGVDGVEAFMLHRQASMAFAAGMYVFPGGGVDPRDAETDLPWAGPSPQEWGTWLGADPAQAAALVCAAVRETFEECGVLLAGPDRDAVVTDVSGADWEADRQALTAHDLAFSDLLRRRDLVLRTDLLRPWAHWVTPEFESRRYDTRFFLACLPAGQRARHVGGEAASSGWWPASVVLAARERGEVALMPPTLVCLEELAVAADVETLLGAERSVVPVMPWVERDGDLVALRADVPS